MRLVPLVILAVVLSGCFLNPGPQQPQSPAPVKQSASAAKAPPVEVEIVVDTHPKLLEACKNSNRPARTIYVDENSKRVFHCVGNRRLTQHVDHGPKTELSEADVPLSAGEQVRWFSKTHTFIVLPVVKGKEAPQNPKAPPTPFPPSLPFSKVPELSVTSPPVESVGEAEVVVQRYKITFDITGLGVVDPDVVCSM